MAVCFLSLGSNRGDRVRNLEAALAAVGRIPRTRLRRTSRLYESSPVGPARQRDFLNLCARITTGLSPAGLLVELKRVEARLGRRPGRRWGPRPIDIDILAHGRRRVRSRLLEIPHPRAARRRFVLAPLAELHPPSRALLRRLNAPSQNVKLFIGKRPPPRP